VAQKNNAPIQINDLTTQLNSGDLRLPAEVAGFVWNQWQLCRGIDGSLRLESVAGLAWSSRNKY